jgi:hypothetical protein
MLQAQLELSKEKNNLKGSGTPGIASKRLDGWKGGEEKRREVLEKETR